MANQSVSTNSSNDTLESCQQIWKRPRTSFTRQHCSSSAATSSLRTKKFVNEQTSSLLRQNTSPQTYPLTLPTGQFRYSGQAATASKQEHPDTWWTQGCAGSTKEPTRSWCRRSR